MPLVRRARKPKVSKREMLKLGAGPEKKSGANTGLSLQIGEEPVDKRQWSAVKVKELC